MLELTSCEASVLGRTEALPALEKLKNVLDVGKLKGRKAFDLGNSSNKMPSFGLISCF